MKPLNRAAMLVTLGLVFLSAVLIVFAFDVDVVANYSALKSKIGAETGMQDSVLHAYLGLMIFGLATQVLNQPFRNMVPWAIVFGVALLNEGLDLINIPPHYDSKFIANCFTDVVFTVVFPSSIVFIAKISHNLGSHRSSRAISNIMKT